MRTRRFIARSPVEAPPDRLWDWHLRPGALERLNPPWAPAEIVESSGAPTEGSRVVLRVPVGPFRARWVAVHRGFVEGREFRDVQDEGPFARWTHTHRFLPRDGGGSFLEDEIEYALPLGSLGDGIGGVAIRRNLERLFAWRHAVTGADLARHAERSGEPRLRLALSGSTGLIGSALTSFLTTAGHRVSRLVRRDPSPGVDEIRCDAAAGKIDAGRLEGLDAVIHLAGENIAAGRWTARRKAAIRDSRILGSKRLAETLAGLRRPPSVLINASAIGFYGDRGEERLDESSEPGSGFLADACREWEAATDPAERAGLRVVKLRIGVVLSAAGGALARMLPLFRLGLGGRIGNGRQFTSWIALDDLLGAVHFLLFEEGIRGPVNAVSPTPLRNAEFTRELARTLRRPAPFPAPAAALRAAMGEMADALLLSSGRIFPGRLEQAGFPFRHPDLESALRFELGRFGEGDSVPVFHHGR